MRPLWFVAGAGAGVYVALKARRAAEALTPEGLHDRLAGLQVGWQLFTDEVRTGMQEKEGELRTRIGAQPGARPGELPDAERRELLAGSAADDDPTQDGPHDGQQ